MRQGFPQRAVSRARAQGCWGAKLVNEPKDSPEIPETPVALNNMRREEDDPSDDGSTPVHLC
jgi:hypothetical protein